MRKNKQAHTLATGTSGHQLPRTSSLRYSRLSTHCRCVSKHTRRTPCRATRLLDGDHVWRNECYGQVQSACFVYDATGDVLSPMPPLNTARREHGNTIYNGALYSPSLSVAIHLQVDAPNLQTVYGCTAA